MSKLINITSVSLAHTAHGAIEYRVEGNGDGVALILYGGHTNVHTRLGEDYFLEKGYRVLVVSRPGYGGTPLSTGPTPDSCADALVELLEQLGVAKVLVVGISGGGRTAMRFAARHRHVTSKLILQGSISFAPYPDVITRVLSRVAFRPPIQKYVWKFVRFLFRSNPELAMRTMLGRLTTLNPNEVVDGLSERQRQELTDLFVHMDSGNGFINDIKTIDQDATDVAVPTLIIHSKYDKGVPIKHALILSGQINNSKLYLSDAESHLIWFSPHHAADKKVMDEFLRH